MAKVFGRIFTDYIQPSRIQEYRNILLSALENGYEIVSVSDYYKEIEKEGVDSLRKFFILRHDLDTNPSFSLQFSKVEKELGITASYYFRLPTANQKVMNTLFEDGHEVGYHYEELSTFCKQNGLRSFEQIESNMSTIKELFSRNLIMLREKTGLPITTVAAHGDFINRKLKVNNKIVLEDAYVRKVNKVEIEAYDIFNTGEVISHSDSFYPKKFAPISPVDSIEKEIMTIQFLTHPRYWKAAPITNTVENFSRAIEGVMYKRKILQ